MNTLLEQEPLHTSVSSAKTFSSLPYRLLRLFTWVMVIAALMAGLILLLSDGFSTLVPHAPVSAAPLLLIGAGSLGFQGLMRPKPLDLFKALIVSSAFLLWGIDQLLPQGWLTTTLADVVIILYVLDLAWMIRDRLQQQRPHHAPSEQQSRVLPSSSGEQGPRILLSPSLPADQQRPQQVIMISRGSPSFLKRKQLVALPCTCASPLAPFQSAPCCREMLDRS